MPGGQQLLMRINDYEILHEMYIEDAQRRDDEDRWFKEADHGGFDVKKEIAFDVALHRLEEKAKSTISPRGIATDVALRLLEEKARSAISQQELAGPFFLLIEFARNDYQHAFQLFSPEFFLDAYFLYLDTSIEICKQRIRARIEKPAAERTADDYYVSDYIFEHYYDHDDSKNLIFNLAAKYGIDGARIKIIDNNIDLEEAERHIAAFVQYILDDAYF